MMNMIDIACFEVNEHGRLLSGNRRFCRMFGFEPSELPWHYVTDLYRHVDDWEKFRRDTENASFTTRMKNRRGRSFDCCIVREIFQNADGEVIFRNTIHKIGEGKGYVPQTVPLSVVFLAKCSDCGAQIRVASAPETRLRMLCNSCAAKAFPETFYSKTAQV
jgi:PAS domain S-box-containing protein